MNKKIEIYDLDGTIICSKHRFRRLPGSNVIDLKHWKENSHLCYKDKLLPLARKYKKSIKMDDVHVIIATSRVLAKSDIDFIASRLGLPHFIVSRKNDAEDTAQLKIKGIQEGIKNLEYEKMTIFEDNISNLKQIMRYFACEGVHIASAQE